MPPLLLYLVMVLCCPKFACWQLQLLNDITSIKNKFCFPGDKFIINVFVISDNQRRVVEFIVAFGEIHRCHLIAIFPCRRNCGIIRVVIGNMRLFLRNEIVAQRFELFSDKYLILLRIHGIY